MARRKEFEREEVLEKALDIFWQNGYNATSFQTLTEGMCINRQSIYDTYGDKHTLFIEALNYYKAKTAATVTAHFEQDKPVKELLKTYFDSLINQIYNDPLQKGCFLANSSLEMIPHDKEVAKIAADNFANLTKAIQKVIARGIKSGELKTAYTPESLASYLINTMQGLITMSKTTRDKKKLQGIADIAMEAIG